MSEQGDHFVRKIACLLLFIVIIFSGVCYGYDIPGFTKNAFGEIHDIFSEVHRNQLVQAGLKEKPIDGHSYPVYVIYSHEYLYVKKDGSFVKYVDNAIKINAPFIKNSIGEPSFVYDSSREHIDILEAAVYTATGKEIRTDISDARVKEPYTGLVYSDLKMKILTLKGLEDGFAARMAYKQTYNPIEEKGFIFHSIDLNDTAPVKEKVFVYCFEAGTPLKIRERFRDRISSLRTKRLTLENGSTAYIYSASDIKAEATEPRSIPAQEYFDRIFFFSPVTWEGVGRWYASLAHDKMIADKDIAAKVAELTKGLSGEEQKTRALYNFVRKIRYVSIALNRHSMIPHPAAETFKNLYGDCKDKASLLVTMLQSAGITAYIALVNTAYLVEKDIPTPLVFNHAVVAVPGPDGTYKFLDPTNESAPYGTIPEYIQHRNALIAKENEGELVLIQLDDLEKSRHEESTQIEFKDLNSVKCAYREIIHGKMEWARMFNSLPQDKLIQLFHEGFSKEYKQQIRIDSVKIESGKDEGEQTFIIQAAIDQFTRPMGNIYAFHPLWSPAGALKDGTVIAANHRKTDIEFDTRQMMVADATFHIPESAAIEFLPENFFMIHEKFGEYRYRVSKTQNTITVHRRFDPIVKRVAVKDYAEFKAFWKKCMDHDSQNVLLRKK
jgi:hypothetical protein